MHMVMTKNNPNMASMQYRFEIIRTMPKPSTFKANHKILAKTGPTDVLISTQTICL